MDGRIDRRAFLIATSALAITPARALPLAAPHRAIEEEKFIPIGGIDQWISIRGADRSNPVLLVVHGGPGEPQWPAESIYRPWEEAFTVVQWDQRGAGHTYGRSGTGTPNVNLDQISKDGVEVADYLRRSLGKRRIIVLGHSWGSLVAIKMVQLRPALFAAYVGTGQVVSWKENVTSQFDTIRATALRDGDKDTLAELDAIGRPDLNNAKQFFSFSRHLRASMDAADKAWFQGYRVKAPKLEAENPVEFKNMNDGMGFSGDHLLPDEMATDLPSTAAELKTAFFVIQGQDDVISPRPAAERYFAQVKAPYKKLIIVPDAGHFAFMTSSTEFLSDLRKYVLPIARARGA